MMNPRKRKEIDQESFTGRFAVRLKTLREKAGLTVEELGEQSGIPYKTLYRWEAASRSPSIDRFPQLAEALGVKVRTLLPEK